MREPENYRRQLEHLVSKFPDKEVLNMSEVEDLLRCNRRTVLADKTFPAKKINGRGKYYIPLSGLAWWLASK